jgi:multidrug efflux pump subunit AcrA (membrane-fusion protein)
MDTQIDVPNPSLILVPGMYAEAVLTIDRKVGVLSVPLEGLDLQGHSAIAYVVDSNHKIQVRQVAVGLETPDRVEVLSGLKQGELVVAGNRSQLSPGQQVTPKLIDASTDKQEEK